MKVVIDAGERLLAILAMIAVLPVVAVAALAIWLQDRRSPFYVSVRVGRNGAPFRLFKLRSMVVGADKSKVDTTVADDPRLTSLGRFIRKFKLDELPQFLNVIIGDMSLVGPRPNVSRETDLYTYQERRILSIKPGITDISSIVFSDLADILSGAEDPNIAYNQLIRPWKSRLALFYVDNMSMRLDLLILLITAVTLISRRYALGLVVSLLKSYRAPDDLVEVAGRRSPLTPMPPPGANLVVTCRNC